MVLMLFVAACAAAENEAPATTDMAAPSQGRSAAPADSAGGATESGSNGATLPSLDRKIIQNATLSLQVQDVGPAYDQVTGLATANGGFVATSRLSYDKDGAQIASVTLKVPANRYDAVLSDLRRLAVKVESEQNGSTDVTEEYTDLQSRLRNLEATEAQYLELMKTARNINEVLSVQDRLNTVRGEIERTKGRINLLDRSSDLGTIVVTLRPVPAGAANGDGPQSLLTVAVRAWQASLTVLRVLATILVSVVVFGWWILPPLALVIYLLRNRVRRPRRPVSDTPSA
jgi:hypothetical protein